MQIAAHNSFASLSTLRLAGIEHQVHRLDAVPGSAHLSFSHKVILENLLRHEDGVAVTADTIRTLVDAGSASSPAGIPFFPSRVFLHDTNGVPVLTDLAALRDAVAEAGEDPLSVGLAVPGELTVDHSVSTDVSGRMDAPSRNVELEYERNAERYRFLQWGTTFDGFTVIPPEKGIMHQINIEHLARVVERRDGWAYPDTCAGTDSHTTMVNGLGVLAWGVGGIEAGAAMLGLPLTMLIPPVVGVHLKGELRPGVTATDLVLTIAERLRAHGVVGKIVEFTGETLSAISLATRATIANMSPEYGSTSAMFPIDDVTLDYLRFTGRSDDHVAAVETYSKEQGLWHDPAASLRFNERLDFDLATVEPSLAGPRRPQDRIPLTEAKSRLRAAVDDVLAGAEGRAPEADALAEAAGRLPHGSIAIAAITSCTNTSNPHVMIGAGLLARNARRRGLSSRPWVKTSLAPGSKTVTDYLDRAGLSPYLDELGFQLVGYGCMTCIGNSGPLLPDVARQVHDHGLVAASVLSGNRNFDGRINNDVSLNYLASPPLVVAYALAGTMDHDFASDPLGTDQDGAPVYLSELWPDDAEIEEVMRSSIEPAMFTSSYADINRGDERWSSLAGETGARFDWDPNSQYLRRPPFLDGVAAEPAAAVDITGARALLMLGDSVTTDHISPAGRIPRESVAGKYLSEKGVAEAELNSYASRRGNYEVMMRGGFSNPRLRNALVAQAPGGRTTDVAGDIVPVYDAAMTAKAEGIPLVVIAGQEYGTGSSRDWAAKVTALLGVRAVIAGSFERIHRANLVQLGVLPLQFPDGVSAESLGLGGREVFEVLGIAEALGQPGSEVRVVATRPDGRVIRFPVILRVDTAQEAVYYRNGGILPFVYRDRMARTPRASLAGAAEGEAS